MLVDFASEGISSGKPIYEAIHEACLARFPHFDDNVCCNDGSRSIAIGNRGILPQTRRPLGLVIVGGLIILKCLPSSSPP